MDNNQINFIGKRLKCLPVFPLIARPGINCGCAFGDMGVAKHNAHHMGRKTKIAEQCCNRAP